LSGSHFDNTLTAAKVADPGGITEDGDLKITITLADERKVNVYAASKKGDSADVANARIAAAISDSGLGVGAFVQDDGINVVSAVGDEGANALKTIEFNEVPDGLEVGTFAAAAADDVQSLSVE